VQIGMVGLGRMGGNIVRRLLRHGHQAVVYDRREAAVRSLGEEGATAAFSLPEFSEKLERPRTAWIMLPAGAPTEDAIRELATLLTNGDTIIDGGNTYFKDDIRRAAELRERGIFYLDVGTSGGVWGLERGYCMMIGGEPVVVERLDPIFSALSPGLGSVARTPGPERRDQRAEHGYIHAGPSGAGHFVKMIHNGIEYGMMQAFAEGFDILRHANAPSLPEERRMDFNLADIAEVWRRGSVVSSWLLDLTAAALAADPDLSGFSGHVEDSGEGRWTINTAIEQAVPATVLTAALYARFRSRQGESFADKMLSAMRKGFGGHQEPAKT
jgi:6-phosphogluconate dehydrogenase